MYSVYLVVWLRRWILQIGAIYRHLLRIIGKYNARQTIATIAQIQLAQMNQTLLIGTACTTIAYTQLAQIIDYFV